ncbi:YlmC/YmxH family sporulation protein [Clostridium sp. MSJ-4]|uniref:YlmC/YmxH family sporulation protein n=1 Tax=Clostridium simiarum TaxID=2841506 RepID=A0ABS6EZZ9_9CLOT|nr:MULTISPECIES: YlmC/YmxH family sporulation protein [Clostridium]MBU5590917.1 YlmC/YmxH family sporulation protein [Clostridium simiarum]
MELDMHSINNIRSMEVIDINTGIKLGYIRDIKIDCENYKILSVLVPIQKNSWFSKMDTIEIPWEKILKVGVDVILVDNDKIEQEEES